MKICSNSGTIAATSRKQGWQPLQGSNDHFKAAMTDGGHFKAAMTDGGHFKAAMTDGGHFKAAMHRCY